MEQMPTPQLQIDLLEKILSEKPNARTYRHKQTQFEIIWIQDGSGYHIIDGLRFPLLPGNIYCVLPGQVHELELAPGMIGYQIHFSDNFLETKEDEMFYGDGFRQLVYQSFEVAVDANAAEDMSDMLMLMMKETRRYGLQRKSLLAKYLMIFLILMRGKTNPAASLKQHGTRANLVQLFFSLLETHFKEEKAVSGYANMLFVSANYLNYVVKAYTGYPAKHHIQQRVLHEAKRAARYQRITLKEIAYHLGFEDSSHFSKYFKNASGENFSVFRKQAVC